MKYRYEFNVKYIPACPYGERYLQPILEAKELMSLWLVSVSSYKLTFLLIQRKHNQLKHLPRGAYTTNVSTRVSKGTVMC